MNTHSNRKLFKPASLFALLAVFAVILAACAPAATPATTPSVAQPPTGQTGSTGSIPTIDVATDPTLGKYLVDNAGKTLYVLTKDAPDASSCDASCQANWPPLLTSGTPKAGPGVDASLISYTALSGGEKIVTYDHRPLYYKSTDQKVGEKTGEAFNNVWFVVSPAGAPINAAGAAVGAQTAAPTAAPSNGPANPTPAAPQAPAATVTEPTIDTTKNATLGNILTANKGMTLYVYTADTQDTSNCSIICQKVWKPLLTNGAPTLGTGITKSMVSNTKLSDGSLVVTYNHMPLYFFVNDTAASQVNGQGFDNVWFAVSPEGKMVGKVSEVSLDVTTNPILGSYLVGQGGQAVYVYANDKPDTSTCTGACAANWIPVITLGKPILGNGVDSTQVGTIKLADGSLMLTYNHKPLYYFVTDARPSDVKGQGIKNVWNVLGPDGNIITYTLPTPPAGEPTINLANNPTFGQILVDDKGMTIYIDTMDLKGESTCLATCMQDWTPLFTLGHPISGMGVNASLVGTLTTSYGLMIATYNGHPLYTAKVDKKPGDVNGEGSNVSWYVISVTGQPVLAR